MPGDLTGYAIEIEWMMCWFPTRASAAIDAPILRAGTLRYKSPDDFPEGLGGAPSGQANLLDVELGLGQINVDLNEAGYLLVTVYAQLSGQPERKKSFVARPASRIPFMVNVIAPDGARDSAGTALSLSGMVSTGGRAIDSIAKIYR